jgi:micrococcal nuclease
LAWTAGVLGVVGVIGSCASGDGGGGSNEAGASSTLVPSTALVLPTASVAPDTTTPGASTASTTTEATTATSPEGWTAVRVIDGDTLDVHGPDGLSTVRLIGINAPEGGECWSHEATVTLERLVATGPLTLVQDESDHDRFGRLLRYVENGAGVDVGGALVGAGHAISRRYPPDTARSDRYDRLQQAARSAGRGQWAADACGTPRQDTSVAIDVHADAAGDDNFNLDDEWVRFTNGSAAPLDLTGWLVADESASHRYTFDQLVLPPGASVTLRTGCGPDGPRDRYWCNRDSAVWNNSGDTVFLRDPSGNNVAVLTY